MSRQSAQSGASLTIRRALISVSDKRGLVNLARKLRERGIEIISTGGTFRTLKDQDVSVTPVSEVTGFPEILDGRVKTLHPNIHAGLLATDNPDHVEQLRNLGIQPIDLVVVNLYPFESTVARADVSLEDAIENIDIGGPAMVRASAKNYRHTAVVVNPDKYDALLEELAREGGKIGEAMRFDLACEAFAHTARYDAAIARYLTCRKSEETLPPILTVVEPKSFTLRYGENPHQIAAFYGHFESAFEKLHGKELSYNNILDLHAATGLCAEFTEPAVVIVKHSNPCGVGTGNTVAEAYQKAFATDKKSAFGGIVAVNRILDKVSAEAMNELFLEIIVAPEFAPDAMQVLQKKKDRRLVRLNAGTGRGGALDFRSVRGGFLVQTADEHRISASDVKTVTKKKPTEEQLNSLLFAWKVAKHVKSNAIVYAKADRTLGIGAGQMSRVDSAKIAAIKAQEAGLDLKGCAVASDAFFPFADGLLEAVRVGASAVIQPGGSVRDEEVIKAANESEIAMVFTGVRHFRH
ncbi:MAG TPA: bifunctional phosphoribosylaminoimidazolecarboxamide formyltransferase/IMP cyclohydrolase [Bacteroidota bacterium]